MLLCSFLDVFTILVSVLVTPLLYEPFLLCHHQGTDGALPRCKPFKYTYEKEIVMYAYFKNLDYFSTECIYSPNAYR